MNVPARLSAFLVLLAVAFGGAALLGAAVDPTDEETTPAGGGHSVADDAHPVGGDELRGEGEHGDTPPSAAGEPHGGEGASIDGDLSGLAVSQDGFTLEPDRTNYAGGGAKRFSFRIVDEGGHVLRDEYEVESERRLHLVVVRRDTATFEHVHPRLDEDGTWSVTLELPRPGVYRAFADFQVDGVKRALATDLLVGGDFKPKPLPEPGPVNEVDGYTVGVRSAQPLRAGRANALTFSIGRRGRPVDDVQPYLGARGHLVVLRAGDLGYLHVHPEEDVDGNAVAFAANFPTAGLYRLFFQFRVGDRVRMVPYTIEVPR